jgi:dextranase
MTTATLPGLKTCYLTGQPVRLRHLPPGTAAVAARSAFGPERGARAAGGEAELAGLPPGTYAVEARAAGGQLLAEELTTVVASQGDSPVPGFVSSFRPDAVPEVLAWLRDLRCTSVQFYDWMRSYTEPLSADADYADRLGRRHSLTAIRELIDGCAGLGATPQAYAPVYAADPDFARGHPDLLLYRGDGEPQRLGDLLDITDPGNPDWQRRWLRAYGEAADVLGFGGFHLDTYGYPRQPLDRSGRQVSTDAAHASFVAAARAARPETVLSFNQVNGVPAAFELPPGPGYRYVEVWPPNDRWRHLEGLLERSGPAGAPAGGVLAIYPPAWPAADEPAGRALAGDRGSALRTVLLTEAVVTTLGASLLVFGDRDGCLQHPYYPDYQRLTAPERARVLSWHRFGLRCRDLFRGGTDTSWIDIGDENGAVSVSWDGGVLPEPAGQAVFARVIRHRDCIVVSVLDLTGSPAGSWQEPAGPGACRGVSVRVLLGQPANWTAGVAVMGRDGGRFTPVRLQREPHREGLAVRAEVPVTGGWSVLRLTAGQAAGQR